MFRKQHSPVADLQLQASSSATRAVRVCQGKAALPYLANSTGSLLSCSRRLAAAPPGQRVFVKMGRRWQFCIALHDMT
jgi:hypothetical protein